MIHQIFEFCVEKVKNLFGSVFKYSLLDFHRLYSLYTEMVYLSADNYPQIISVYNQPARSTQPSIPSR